MVCFRHVPGLSEAAVPREVTVSPEFSCQFLFARVQFPTLINDRKRTAVPNETQRIARSLPTVFRKCLQVNVFISIQVQCMTEFQR